MIKHINHQNFLTTPFVAVKQWELFNVQNDDLVLMEPPDTDEVPVALDYVDYSGAGPVLSRECDIALEQQSEDAIIYQEGVSGSGFFDPNSDSQNSDGTFKRLVHAQIKSAFYNKYRNPTQIFGVDFIDFPVSKTDRQLTDMVRIFTIPRHYFGERIVEGSVRFYDNSLDDNVEVYDDRHQNLMAGHNLFSKVQEVRGFNLSESFHNIIMTGYVTNSCPVLGDIIQVNGSENMSSGLRAFTGEMEIHWSTEVFTDSLGFLGGAVTQSVFTESGSEASNTTLGFLSGEISSLVQVESGSLGNNDTNVAFLSGSCDLGASVESGSIGTSNVNAAFLQGSCSLMAMTTSGSSISASLSVGFLHGALT